MNIGINGINGKMGKAVASALTSAGHTVIDIDPRKSSTNWPPQVDIIVDFTNAQGLEYLIGCLFTNQVFKPIIIGTTGYGSMVQELMDDYSKRAPMVVSSNFSISVQGFFAAIDNFLNAIDSLKDVTAVITETHHASKKDAPSGTAIALKELMAEYLGKNNVRIDWHRTKSKTTYGIHDVSIKIGGAFIEFKHESGGRDEFAQGVLRAVDFLSYATKPGASTMQDVLGL